MLRRMSNRPSVFKRWFEAVSSRTLRKMSVLNLEVPEKSEGDKKLYRALELSNGLRAMLVSDPEMDERSSTTSQRSEKASRVSSTSSESLEEYNGKLSACAVIMSVGSFYEPKKYQGLAHFLEHMIFMGSGKYPEENAFDAFVTKVGGFSNAHTEDENTCFYFEVEEQYLDKTLDMFMNLMKAPLMSIDSMTRERFAVQSEFEQVCQVDEVRRDQVMATMATENYPHATFGWGNLKSLAENVNDVELHNELKDFYRKHYGSNRMTVCIQSTLSLDELQKILLLHCSDIPRSLEEGMDMSKFKYRDAFQEHFFRDVLLVKPVEDVCKLDLNWVVPPMRNYYRVKPCRFASHLLGYEGVGSLCAYLRRRLWGMSVQAGETFTPNSIFSMYNLCIWLTDEGFEHLDEVIAVTFAWIRMLCSPNTTLHQKYKEVQQMAETNFRFQMEYPSIINVVDIATGLRIFPIRDVLTGNNIYFEYNDEIVKMVQQHLSEFRFQISISSHIPYENCQYDQKERWFGTQFTQITMPEKWKTMWTNPEPHPELQFPASNPFVPTDFAIHWVKAGKPHIPRRPKALIRNELCELWFRQDDTFLLPDGVIIMNLMTPVMHKSVKDFLAGILFTYLVEFGLAEQVYPALTAGLSYGLGVTDTGFEFNVRGYNEKMPLLCEMLVDVMKKLEVNPAQVMSFREIHQRQIFNFLIDPNILNKDLRLSVMEQRRWTLLEKYEAIKTVTPQDVERFRETFHKQMYIQALIQGNFTEQQARQVTENVLNTFNSSKLENYAAMNNRTVQLPPGEFFLRVKSVNEDDTNTVLANYHQLGPNSVTMTVMLELLDLITEEPFFNQLRTKEQMCYSLGIVQRISYGIGGYLLYINTQETKFAADFVEKRMEKFRLSVPDIVNQLSQEEYEQFRQALINQKKQANLSLDEELSENWPEITSLDYFFNRTELEINALGAIQKKDLLDFMQLHANTNMRKLSVQVIGSSHIMSQSDEDDTSSAAPTQGSRSSRPGSLAQVLSDVHTKISDDQQLFEQIGDRLRLEFIGDGTNPSHIMNIAEFKKNLHVYPRICVNPKINKNDT